ncbi:SprT family zinc-dependent metalloprotease [Altererythrobacter aquiaggeris]|uniref:M48 family metallopeptidase n=1 Tax=Aestuarierythrobacter aquiaggeris TaxID=1898396 RepID=UPI00301715C5
MIEWLTRSRQDPRIEVGGHLLPIAVRRHARASRMTLRLAPDGSEVRVTLPQWGRTAEAIAFAESRRDWLDQQLVKVPPALKIGPGSTFEYRGAKVSVVWQAEAARRPVLANDRLTVGGPIDNLAPRIGRWLEKQALRHIRGDLAEYCQNAGAEVPSVRLSRAQRRWGSCASDGTIRINWRLIQAPDCVRRSVVAHEVAHLVHFDHSPAFYQMLAAIYADDLSAADRWLKAHGRSLYAAFG